MLELIVYIAILGVIVWGITTLVPMPAPFKTVIYVIAVVLCLLLLLRVLGGVSGGVHLP